MNTVMLKNITQELSDIFFSYNALTLLLELRCVYISHNLCVGMAAVHVGLPTMFIITLVEFFSSWVCSNHPMLTKKRLNQLLQWEYSYMYVNWSVGGLGSHAPLT